MRTPLENDQPEDAVFDVFANIQPRTIGILTRSVKYRVRLCIARQGGFVGDALDECCRLATEEYDSMNTIQPMSIYMNAPRGSERQGSEDGEDNLENSSRLPSFRSVQKQSFQFLFKLVIVYF